MGSNQMKMREALENVRFYLPYFLQYMRLHWEDAEAGGYYERILEVVNAALSAPPRNCDVGTAEEQYQRYEKFCCSHYRIADNGNGNCLKCPFAQPVCKLSWMQMPYEAEEGGAK